jgi:hypothetical protein
MSTTKSGGIFTFDHGQKSLNKAIGVEQSYLEDLASQLTDTLRDFIFDGDRNPKKDLSQSGLVEICATEFSYSQLVIMSSFYLQDKIDAFSKSLEKKVKGMKSGVKSVAINADDIPPHIKEILDGLTGGDSKANAIDGDSLPPELKDFLKKLSKEQEEDED